MYQHILIGLNQSESAQRALLSGISLASRLNATVIAMGVVPPLPAYEVFAGALSPEAPQVIRSDEHESFVQLLEIAHRTGSQYSVQVDTIVTDGPVVDSLVEAVRKHQIDLLVLGIHPEQGLLGWLTASTAHELAQKAVCDVLAVR